METALPNPGASAFTIVALSLLTVGSALAVGTVHAPVLLVVGIGAVAACSVVLFLERADVRRLSAPAVVLMGLSLWSAVQAIPIPLRILSVLAPANADVWARALRPLGEAPLRTGSISLDPGASLIEALKWFVYALILTMAQRTARVRSGRPGITIAFVSAVIVSLVTLAHGLVGATSLFGLYTPEFATPRWGVPPILNPNSLSGYLNLGAFCGLGLLLERRHRDEHEAAGTRVVILAGVAIVVAVSVLAASRGGVLGLGFGTLVLAVLLRPFRAKPAASDASEPEREPRRSRTLVPVIVAIAGGVLLGVVGSSDATWGELRDTSSEKIRLWAWSVPLIENYPWFGIGRGAFETVFPAYRQVGGRIVFTHAENFIVQWISEWGFPVAVTALLALAWMLRPRRLGLARKRARLGAYVGVAVLLLQNLVDLALEIPAVAILLFLVLGSLRDNPPLVSADPSEEDQRPLASTQRRFRLPLSWRLRRRYLAYSVFLGGALTVTLAAAFGRPVASDERAEVHQVYDGASFGEPSILAAFAARLREAILRHPADPYFPLMGALAANRTKGANAMPWIAAALERDVMCGRAHLVLALVLMRAGAVDQALMELRFAVEDDLQLTWTAGYAASRLTSDLEKLDRMMPRGSLGAAMFLAAAQSIAGKEGRELRGKLVERAVERDPTNTAARLMRARDLLAASAAASVPCEADAKAGCLAQVRMEADAIQKFDASSCEPLLLRAESHESEGRTADAESLLATECGGCSEKARCTQRRVEVAARIATVEPLASAARAYLAVACGEEAGCIIAHQYLGNVFATRADWWLAADQYSQAATMGRTPDSWLRAADASLKAGNVGRASWALLRARRDGAGNAALEPRIEQLQKQIGTRGGNDEH